jgi:hypothetical protein
MNDRVFRGIQGFAEEAAGQIEYMEPRTAVHARFLREATDLLAGDAGVRAAVLEAWRDRVFRARYERPLLLCVAVRWDALRDPDHPLRRALGAEPPDAAVITRDAVRAALLRPAALGAMRDRFVQTNEVTRAVTWRWPLGLVARGRRAALVDLGCSAGLNLVADRIDLAWNVPTPAVPIVRRLGLDRAPVDLRDDDARAWLRASIWPGQTERLARFDAVVARLLEAEGAGELALEAHDAGGMPARLEGFTSELPEDVLVCAYQTVMADYVLPDVLAGYHAAMDDWLLRHGDRAMWCELERAPKGAPMPTEVRPAELRVHVARGGAVRTLVLGSGEFHPAEIVPNEAAVAELTAR